MNRISSERLTTVIKKAELKGLAEVLTFKFQRE